MSEKALFQTTCRKPCNKQASLVGEGGNGWGKGSILLFCRNIPYLNELSLLAYLASCSSSLFLISITSARDSDSTSCSSLSSPGCPSPQMVSYSLIRQNDHKLTLLRVLRRTYALYKWKKCHSRLGN